MDVLQRVALLPVCASASLDILLSAAVVLLPLLLHVSPFPSCLSLFPCLPYGEHITLAGFVVDHTGADGLQLAHAQTVDVHRQPGPSNGLSAISWRPPFTSPPPAGLLPADRPPALLHGARSSRALTASFSSRYRSNGGVTLHSRSRETASRLSRRDPESSAPISASQDSRSRAA